MRKLYLSVSIIMLLTLILTACAAPATTTAEPAATQPEAATQPAVATEAPTVTQPKTLVVWYKKEMTQNTLDLITQWAEEFGKQKGIKVDLTFVTAADQPTLYVAGIESGTAPDVAMVPFWGPPRYHNMGALADVTDVVTEVGPQNGGFLQQSLDAITFEGKMWGVPWISTTQPMYIRTDVLKAVGLTQAPQTMDELANFADLATKYGAGKLFGWGMGYTHSDDGHLMTQQILWHFGSQTTAEDGKTITFNSPETVAGCNYMAQFYTNGDAVPGAMGWTDSGNNQAWLANQIAITGNGPSVFYALSQPDGDKTLLANTTMYAWPAGVGTKGINASIDEASSWVIFAKDPGAQSLAKDWLRYIYSPDRLNLIYESSFAQEGPATNSGMKTAFMNQPAFAGLRTAISNAVIQGYPGPYTVAAADVASEYVLPDMMADVIVNKMSCEDAVKKATAKIQAIYARYNKY